MEYFKNNIKPRDYSKGLYVLKHQKQITPFKFDDLFLESELILLVLC